MCQYFSTTTEQYSQRCVAEDEHLVLMKRFHLTFTFTKLRKQHGLPACMWNISTMIVWKNTNEAVVKMVPKSHWYLNLELFFFHSKRLKHPSHHIVTTQCAWKKKRRFVWFLNVQQTCFFFFFYVVFTKAESLLTLLSSLSGSLFTTSLIQSKNGVKEIPLNTRPVAFLICVLKEWS